MEDKTSKITIKPQQIQEAQSSHERTPAPAKILVKTEELTPSRGGPLRSTGGDAPMTDKRVVSKAQSSGIVLVLLTLVPLVNAWVWHRRSRSAAELRFLYLAVSVLLGAISVALIVGLCFLVFHPSANWIEQIAAKAERAAVRIETPEGFGTGFVIASRGNRHLVLTNRHVVAVNGESTATCTVVPRYGNPLPGQVVGLPRDSEVDLALLLVESVELRTLGAIRPFEQVHVGENVIAIGNPLEFDFTVTQGIVSAKREGTFAQITAAINPGNSGGPLLDESGRVIGVNFLKRLEAEGIGFAWRADIACHPDEWTFSADVSDLVRSIEQ